MIEDNHSLPLGISWTDDWEFGYTADLDRTSPELPGGDIFVASMPVPGYWDDHVDRLQDTSSWSHARFNPAHRPLDYPLGDDPPDASTPFLQGVGWYRRRFDVPGDWQGHAVLLRVGGVRLEAWVWLNGVCIRHHLGHSSGFCIDLTGHLNVAECNDVVIAVANTREDRIGCAIRGWKGFSGGITGPVSLHVAAEAAIVDAFVWRDPGDGQLHWRAWLTGHLEGVPLTLEARIRRQGKGNVLSSVSREADAAELRWRTESPDALRPWSDRWPALYEVELDLRANGRLVDSMAWRTGFRSIARHGRDLLLNGQPIFLRGATEHGYYPETCTPPLEKSRYRYAVSRLKDIGFNWLRFHTSVPSEPYMQAADELGMMIQVEPPAGFETQEWLDILRACRNHPSVVIYCCGNEELLDDRRIEQLADYADLQKEHAPNALFNPHEALRGIEYCWHGSDFGPRVKKRPYPHTPHRLKRLKTFSDCIGQYAWGQLSYGCTRADVEQLNARMEPYERPLLSHENGIIGNYLDLSLAWKYEGSRIGTGMFDSLRQNLSNAGLLERADTYYRHSCAWAAAIRKHNMETARRCKYINGYDFLGGIDCHWHRVGYPCGVLNEFYQLKPGDTRERILQYNGESILLMGWDESRNRTAGETIQVPLFAAIYGHDDQNGLLMWRLRSADGEAYATGRVQLSGIRTGATVPLHTVSVTMPDVDAPLALVLETWLTTDELALSNDWPFWCFPEQGDVIANACAVVDELDAATVEALSDGAPVVFFGTTPFKALPTSFQPACAGRAKGNLATVIADHPLMQRFPHQGWCDWQFAPLLEGGSAVVFNDLDAPFDPIVEVVSSFKSIRKQAALFEYRVGRGRLLCCSLNVAARDPGATWLRQRIIRYADSPDFEPQADLAVDALRELVAVNPGTTQTTGTDQGFDARGQLSR